MVKLDGHGKVSEVFLDMKHKYDKTDDYAMENKTWKKQSLNAPETIEAYLQKTDDGAVSQIITDFDELSYTVEFSDGSYYKKRADNSNLEIGGDKESVIFTSGGRFPKYRQQISLKIIATINAAGYLTDWNRPSDYVVLPQGLRGIESGVSFPSSRKSLMIPSSVTSMGTNAFRSCDDLKILKWTEAIRYTNRSTAICTIKRGRN